MNGLSYALLLEPSSGLQHRLLLTFKPTLHTWLGTSITPPSLPSLRRTRCDVGLEYSPLGNLDELTLVTFSDAAFASRQNHASQGGFLVTMVNKSALESGTASKYHILDWRSFKLARVARSTLAAEGQAASEAADAHLFATTFLKAMTTASYHLQQPDPYSWINASALVIDAKALYDVLSRDALQATSSSDKRTFLEPLVTRDKLREAKAHIRWVSSERQYADGLTKTSAAQLLADRLRVHEPRLMEDSTYQAARKKPLEERRASAYQYARPRSSTTRTTTSTATSTATTSMPSSTLFCLTMATTLQLGAATYDLVPSYHEVAVFGNVAETMAGLLTFLLMVIAVFFIYVRPSVPWPLRTLPRATLHHACTQTEGQPPDGPPGFALAVPLRQSHDNFVQTDQIRYQSDELGGSLRTTLETTATQTEFLLQDDMAQTDSPDLTCTRQQFRQSRQPGVLSHRVEPLSIQPTHLNKNSNAPSFGYGNFRTRSKAYSIALEPFLAVHRELMMSATFTFAPAARCGIVVRIAQGPSPATGLIPSYVDRATTALTRRLLCQTSQALQQLRRPQDVDGAWPLLLFSS